MGSMTDPIRVALVDDHALLREGVRRLLESECGISVCGEASDALAAVALVAEARPDVVLLGVEMRGCDVLETVKTIKEVHPDVSVIILGVHDDSSLVWQLLGAGISGYLLKSVTGRELNAAIRAIRDSNGHVIIAIARESLADGRGDGLLSRRERETLELAAQAMSNSQIAKALSVTEATVKRHLHNAFRKLGAVSRIDAVNKAKAASIIG